MTELSPAFALSVPHPKAIEIRDDAGFFQAVRAAIAKTDTTGKSKSRDDMDAAIRQIISRAVASEEVVFIDWSAKQSVRTKLRGMVKRILRKQG